MTLSDEERKERQKAWKKKYRDKPEAKAKERERRARPEVMARGKIFLINMSLHS